MEILLVEIILTLMIPTELLALRVPDTLVALRVDSDGDVEGYNVHDGSYGIILT